MSSSFYLRRTILFIGPVAALLLTLVGVFALHISGGTFAASASRTTLFVGHVIGSNTGCASPGFTSVQSAVDAAHAGNTVYLCGTTAYFEQVIITKAINVTGDPGAILQAPVPFLATPLSRLPSQFATDKLFIPQAIVIVWGAGSNAAITNLTIAGPLPTNGGCANEEYGVLVIAGGNATLKGDHVTNIHDSNSTLYGCQFGVGIQVGRKYWPSADFQKFLVENFTGKATIKDTVVTGYQKNGITIDGPGTKAEVVGNKVQGSGRDTQFAPIIGQNGVQISRGANVSISNNLVADNTYTGSAPASSAGILVFGGCGDPLVVGVDVKANVLLNNDVGIYLNNYSSATDCSAPATQRTNDRAENNTISNDAVTNVGSVTLANGTFNGYQAGIDDVGNGDVITRNLISDTGYTPARTTPPGPFVIPIDTISFATVHPKVRANFVI